MKTAKRENDRKLIVTGGKLVIAQLPVQTILRRMCYV